MRSFIRRSFLSLIESRTFWRIRGAFQSFSLHIGKRLFRFKQFIQNSSTDLRILLALIRAAVPSVVLIVLLLGLILLGVRASFPSRWPKWVTYLFEDVGSDSQSAYDGFLIAVVTVTGVFLTLYFTSITTVAGTLYARTPERIRSLLLQERVGNVYIRLLVLLTGLSTSLLIAGAVWDFRPAVAVLSTGVLTLASVQAFVRLGQRAFGFLDPTTFADRLLWDLGQWSHQATTNGFRWRDPSFQNYYRQRAEDTIKGLEALIAECQDEEHLRREPLKLLFSRLSVFLPIYLRRKRLIPTKSRWYRQVAQHKAWYMSPHHSVEVATKTQTDIQPELKPFPKWVEEEIFDLVRENLMICLNDGRVGVGAHILDDMASCFKALGANWNVRYGRRILRKTTRMVGEFLSATEAGTLTDHEEGTDKLALTERLSLLPIQLLLGLVEDVERANERDSSTALAEVNWRRTRDIYELDLPPGILEKLELLQRQVRFEIQSEGTVVSPEWYREQFLFQEVAYTLSEQVTALTQMPQAYFLHEADQLRDEDKHLYAAVLLSSGLQFCSKVLVHLKKLENLAESLEEARVLKQMQWTTLDWEGVQRDLERAQDRLILSLARCIPGLATTSRIETIPDYFGKAVHLAGEWCFRFLLAGDADSFSELFRYYFTGALSTREALREEAADWDTWRAVQVMSGPLIDLCELSGYAYLLSEIHQEPGLWEACRAIWDDFIERSDETINLLAATIAHHRQTLGMTSRSLQRTQWKMHIDRLLSSMPRSRSPERHPMAGHSPIPHYREVIDHPSLLVRVMGGTESHYIPSFFEGLDIFVDLYLKQRPEAQGLDFGQHGDLLEALDRWQRNEEERDGS